MAYLEKLDALGGSDAPADCVANAIREMIPMGMNLELDAESFVDQAPVALDTPIDVTFGAAQGTVSDPVMLSAGGIITFNQELSYDTEIALSVGRVSNPGTARVFIRVAIDPGVGSFILFSNPVLTILSDNDFLIPERIVRSGVFPANSRIKVELGRDSGDGGINDGGLYGGTATGLGWGASVRAKVRVASAPV